DSRRATIELYKLNGGHYVPVAANAAGRYLVEPLGLELGLWQATILGMDLPWLRGWDAATGQMVPTPGERAQAERGRAEAAESLLDDYCEFVTEAQEQTATERKRAEKFAEKLRSLGVDPDAA